MHFIELEKYKKKNTNCDTKLEQWLWLIIGESEEKIKMAEEKNEEVKKAVELIDKLSQDEKEREEYEAREKLLMDIRVGKNCAREEGEAIGFENGKKSGKIEGKTEAKSEDAIAMIKEKMSNEVIARVTGLTVTEIEELRKSV